MHFFTTLFDKRYLTRGLCLYESLVNVMDEFKIYILALDDDTYSQLGKSNLENAVIVHMEDFLDEDLRIAKSNRDEREFSWTCASNFTWYVMNQYLLPACVYLDADIYFFNNPSGILDWREDRSVILTSHNYASEYEQSETSGKYCVQFVGFRNDYWGMKALEDWKNQCLDWCYARFEEGKFGDQKYLDNWENTYENVYVVDNIGAGVAPWNAVKYDIYEVDGIVYACANGEEQEKVIFYHFHAFKWFDKDVVQLCRTATYRIDSDIRENIYRPYIGEMLKAEEKYGTKCFDEKFLSEDLEHLKTEHYFYRKSGMKGE